MKALLCALSAVAASVSALASVVTNDYFGDITSPTTLRGITNIVAKSASVNINADLTLTDRTFLWLRGEDANKNNAIVSLAPTAGDATLTVEGNSGFFLAYRYSGDAANFLTTPWGMAGIDPANKDTPNCYYTMRIGVRDGAPGSTGKGKIVVRTRPEFGGNARGGIWSRYLYVESSVAPGDDGYVDFLDIANYAFADISHIEPRSTVYPARILFRGGTIFRNNATAVDSPLAPAAGATLVLQSVDDANICLHKQFMVCNFTARLGGTVRIVGKDLHLSVSGNYVAPPSSVNFRPWNLSPSDNVQWQITGDVYLKENTWLCTTDGDDLLPYGPGVGTFYLQHNAGVSKNSVAGGTVVAYCALDVCGTRQHVNSVVSTAAVTDDHRIGVITNSHASAHGALVFGAGNVNGRLYAKSTANVTIEKEGTGQLSVENTTGETIDVKAGEAMFSGATVFTNVIGSAGASLSGTLRVSGSLSGAPDAQSLNLVLDEGAVVEAAGTIEVCTVTRGGVALEAGVYEAATTPWIASGKVVVMMRAGDVPAEVTWTGAGTTAAVSDADNWSDGNADWQFPRTRPVFATAGAEAVLDDAKTFFGGLRFDAQNDFTIRAADPSNVLALYGSMDVARRDAATERVYRIEAPVEVNADQVITLTTNTTVELLGGVSSKSHSGLTLQGFKLSSLPYDYTDGGRLVVTNLRLSGEIVHTSGGGWLVLRGDVGNPGDAAKLKLDYLRRRNNTDKNAGHLGGGFTRLENATIWKPVDIYGAGQLDGSPISDSWFIAQQGTTNIFKEHVYCSVSTTLTAEDGSTMIFEKGARASGGSFCPRNVKVKTDTPAKFIFNGPVRVEAEYRGFSPKNYVSVILNSVGNYVRLAYQVGNSTTTFNADDAFDDTGLLFDNNSGRVELGGTHQKFNWLIGGDMNGATLRWFASNNLTRVRGLINGEYPSAIEITKGAPDWAATAVTNCGVRFSGWVKLEKSGNGVHRMIPLAHESFGDVEASGGVLAFDAGATWLNGTNVTVRGTGKLKLDGAGTFGKQIAVACEGNDWAMELGGLQKADTFTVDGRKMPGGTYDSTHKLLGSHFSGAGALLVKSVGFSIIVR